jgi:hypothetical protein
MKNLVIVSFPAKTETLIDLKEALKSALPDTRSFEALTRMYFIYTNLYGIIEILYFKLEKI